MVKSHRPLAVLLVFVYAGWGTWSANGQENSPWHSGNLSWRSLADGAALPMDAAPAEAFSCRTQSYENGIRVEFTLTGLMTEPVEAAGQRFTRLSAPGLGVSGDLGAPEIPVWRRYVEVPLDAADVRLVVAARSSETKSAESLGVADPVFPVQPPREKTPAHRPTKPFAWNRELYAQSFKARKIEAQLDPVGVSRGRRLYMVTVYPLDYDPAARQIAVTRSLTFDVLWDSAKSPAVERDERYRSPLIDATIDPWTMNPASPPEAKGLPSLPIGYLVIAAPVFASDANLANLIQWKTARGFHTTLATTSDTGTTTTDIKSYLQNAYQNWAVPPTFVLLVGDTGAIPRWVGTEEDYPDTDLYYTTVDGAEWNTPDLWIGRLSVSTSTELANAIQKGLKYEFAQWDASYSGWERRAALLASTDNYSITEGTHNAVISSYLQPAGYTVNKLYTRTYGATTDDVRNAINAGRSLVIYSGHGAENQWADGPVFYQSDVAGLTNVVYPFVMSFACLTGRYSMAECFGETWLRKPKAGLAFWGSSVTSYWDEDDILEKRIFEGAYAHDLTWLRAMLNYGQQGLYTYYGGGGDTHRYFEMYNLLGDPSIDLYMNTAAQLTVSHAQIMQGGAATFAVQVAQGGALVALSQPGTVLGAALSSGGSATVTLSPRVYSGSVTLTVTRHNYVPYQDSVTVVSQSDGVIHLDQDAYGCPDTVTVSVADADLAGNTSQSVTLRSASDQETLFLPVTGSPSVFEGASNTAAGPAHAQDGVLQVVDGDTITAAYEDLQTTAGHAVTRTDTATVDAVAPTISNVALEPITATSARVTFDTSEPTTARVSCAESAGGPYPIVKEDPTLAVSHALNLTELSPSTTYYFVVDAWDAVGNQDADTESRSFDTLKRTDYFTEIFSEDDNDLSNMTLTFTPGTSPDYYNVAAQPAASFPTDPAGGTALVLGDDGYQEVALAAGKQVALYGVSYGSFFVCANGYITFGEGSEAYVETLDEHFRLPRIAALFDDLNPVSDGAVSWRQLDDRAVVTFQNVPEYSPPTLNSFQIEMFCNGVIRTTWLDINAADGLAGLSRGTGVPADFFESDLSSYPESVLDTDGDGITDVQEIAEGLDPALPDTDGDGVLDGAEVAYDGNALTYNPYDPTTNPNGTDLNARNPDTDGDGYRDGAEVAAGANPLNASDYPVWRVDLRNTTGHENGASWETALTTIQAAIDAAAAGGGGEVWVAKGQYAESLTLQSQVAVYGAFAGNETALSQRDVPTHPTVIDAGTAAGGQPAHHAVVMMGLTRARLDGFLIVGGKADGADADGRGGGIVCADVDDTSTIAQCVVADCSAAAIGGGIACTDNAAPLIINCTIGGNSAAFGAGVGCLGASPRIVNAVIGGNSAGKGGGIGCAGSASPTIRNCTITSNIAASGGGIVAGDAALGGGCSPEVTNTILENNTGRAVFEGATDSDCTVRYCLFSANPDGDYHDENAAAYTGAANINVHVAGALKNVDGDPLFAPGTTGAWAAAPSYAAGTNRTTLTAAAGSFPPCDLAGRLINCDTGQRTLALIVANTDSTVVVAGDVTGVAGAGDSYRVMDYHIRPGSPCIDTGGAAK